MITREISMVAMSSSYTQNGNNVHKEKHIKVSKDGKTKLKGEIHNSSNENDKQIKYEGNIDHKTGKIEGDVDVKNGLEEWKTKHFNNTLQVGDQKAGNKTNNDYSNLVDFLKLV